MKHPRTFRTMVASVLLFAFGLQACATTGPLVGKGADPGQSALICGAGGAAVGAAAGAAIGSRKGTREALVGALVGGLIGAVVAATACFAITYKSQSVKDYEETKKDVSYKPSQGNVVQITEFKISPAAAAPGQKVTFNASYYVMAPDPDQDLSIVETRIVTAVDPSTGKRKELGRHSSQVTVKPGSRRGDGEFEVKSGVSEGRYEIAFKVDGAGQSDSKMLSLVVTKNEMALRDPGRQVAKVTAEPFGAKSQEARPPEEGKASGAAAGQGAPSPSAPASAIPDVSPAPLLSAPEQPLSALGETDPAPPPAVQTAAAVTPQPLPAKVAKERYFVASKLAGKGNLREGPGTTYKVVGEITQGERFVLLDTVTPSGLSTPWHKIRLEDGREAWVSGAVGEEVQE